MINNFIITNFFSRYQLVGPASKNRKKWAVPSDIRQKFMSGFVKEWSAIFTKLSSRRITRHTPHKATPKRPPEDVDTLNITVEALEKLNFGENSARKPRRAKGRLINFLIWIWIWHSLRIWFLRIRTLTWWFWKIYFLILYISSLKIIRAFAQVSQAKIWADWTRYVGGDSSKTGQETIAHIYRSTD